MFCMCNWVFLWCLPFLHAYQSSGKMVSSRDLIYLTHSFIVSMVLCRGCLFLSVRLSLLMRSIARACWAFLFVFFFFSPNSVNCLYLVLISFIMTHFLCLHHCKPHVTLPSVAHSFVPPSQWSYGFYLIHLQGKQGFQFFCKTEETKRKWMEQFDMAMWVNEECFSHFRKCTLTLKKGIKD